jgi:hypothetical protein
VCGRAGEILGVKKVSASVKAEACSQGEGGRMNDEVDALQHFLHPSAFNEKGGAAFNSRAPLLTGRPFSP